MARKISAKNKNKAPVICVKKRNMGWWRSLPPCGVKQNKIKKIDISNQIWSLVCLCIWLLIRLCLDNLERFLCPFLCQLWLVSYHLYIWWIIKSINLAKQANIPNHIISLGLGDGGHSGGAWEPPPCITNSTSGFSGSMSMAMASL